MIYTTDLGKIIFESHSLIAVNVLYFLPDQKSLLNEFYWQTLDVAPKYPRIYRFIEFWKHEIEAQIKEVKISVVSHIPNPSWKNGIILDLD